MAHCSRLQPSLLHWSNTVSIHCRKPTKTSKLCVRSCSLAPENSQKLVAEVKQKLEKEQSNLPVGKYGRDDEEMILWFLKDRKFSVEDAVSRLTKAIRWREEFGVSELSEVALRSGIETGKAYVHDYLDINDRPVLVVEGAKHFAGVPLEDERLCVFFIEKALKKLPSGKQEILVLVNLRGFKMENADIRFIGFVFDAFYYYYPKRLGEVLFVDAPFIFKPVWQLIKPLMRSYASLAKFCSAKDVKEKYFTADTVPSSFQ